MRALLKITKDDETLLRCVLHAAEVCVVGRGPQADLRLEDKRISRAHARFELLEDGLYVEDAGSVNGTQRGKRSLPPNAAIRLRGNGDEIMIGPFTIRTEIIPHSGDWDVSSLNEVQTALPPTLRPLYPLGKGAHAVVWACLHEELERRVAVKIVKTRKDLRDDEEEWLRFVREARVLARIDCPQVVRVHEFNIESTPPYMVMELVFGLSLSERLRQSRPSISEALANALDLAHALQALGHLGVVHRDIKPSNILLTANGTAKLSDFGIAKDLTTASSLTAQGIGLGTLSYMAPEQLRQARNVDASADVYGLGATLYHLVAGVPPFYRADGEALLDVLTRVIEEEAPGLRGWRAETPLALEALVLSMLAKDPEARPSVDDVIERLTGLKQAYPAVVDPMDETQAD